MQLADDNQIAGRQQKCSKQHDFEAHPEKSEGQKTLPRDNSKIQGEEWLDSEDTIGLPLNIAPEIAELDYRWFSIHGSTMDVLDIATATGGEMESTMSISTSSPALSGCFHSSTCFFPGCSDPSQKYNYTIVDFRHAAFPAPMIEGDEYCLVDPSLKVDHFDGPVRVILILVNCTSESEFKQHLFVLPEGERDDELENNSAFDDWHAF